MVGTVKHCQRLVCAVQYNLRMEISSFQERSRGNNTKEAGVNNTD